MEYTYHPEDVMSEFDKLTPSSFTQKCCITKCLLHPLLCSKKQCLVGPRFSTIPWSNNLTSKTGSTTAHVTILFSNNIGHTTMSKTPPLLDHQAGVPPSNSHPHRNLAAKCMFLSRDPPLLTDNADLFKNSENCVHITTVQGVPVCNYR